MILVDHLIRSRVADGTLNIGNFEKSCVQPASYDLRLGNLIYSPLQPERAIDLTNGGGGAYRLPPYGTAIVTTFEDLKLPNNLLGRIGLKSSFARTGLVASTGPQIDPGFNGKLFVSLFNLTAAPHVLKYRDTFLTIEFHTLDTVPEHGYEGPYQGKHTIGPEVLESLVKLEGLTLSEMQSQFTELAKHVEKWSSFAARFDEFIATMNEQNSAIRQLISQGRVEKISDDAVEIIPPLREISVEDAADEILILFRKRKKLYYSDIAELLSIDLRIVIKACALLEKRGVIEGAKNVTTRAKRARS
jgi:dCTP deaminase